MKQKPKSIEDFCREVEDFVDDLLCRAAFASQIRIPITKFAKHFPKAVGEKNDDFVLQPSLPKDAGADLRDSYRSLLHLQNENASLLDAIHECSEDVHELSKGEVEPPFDEDYPFTIFAVKEVETKIMLLQDAIIARQQIDWMRYHQNQVIDESIVLTLARLDTKLRQGTSRILDSFAPGFGPTPDMGTHAYARSYSPLERATGQRYRDLVNRKSAEAATVVASSFEGALHSLLVCLKLRWKTLRLATIGKDQTYFETNMLFRALKEICVIDELKKQKSPKDLDGETDVIFFEAIPNRINANRGSSLLQIISAAQELGVRAILIDVTLDPFFVSRLKQNGGSPLLLITIDSVSKYAQSGHNLALGGVGMISQYSAGNEKEVENIKGLAKAWRDSVALQGQQMDQRLAWSIHRDAKIYRERLIRMRRNARGLRLHLQANLPDLEFHHARSSGGRLATFFYFEFPVDQTLGDGSTYEWPIRTRKDGIRYYREAKPETYERIKRFGRFVCREIYVNSLLEDPGFETRLIRFSTSFGFNSTSVMPICLNKLYLRVAAGMENAETLTVVKEILQNGLNDALHLTR